MKLWSRRQVERYADGVIDSFLAECEKGVGQGRAKLLALHELAGALDFDESHMNELDEEDAAIEELEPLEPCDCSVRTTYVMKP
ncbi:MAG TPA: hypothetical protein VF814_04690 [Casimicrobiaceae bacterium]